jgi:hypothetical protein
MFEVREELQPVTLQVGIQGLVFRHTITALTATAQVLPQPIQQITVETIEHAITPQTILPNFHFCFRLPCREPGCGPSMARASGGSQVARRAVV